ncbi:MAG TPA: WGR domain-containing protein, partial [Spirochaetota bacterium]|nr:WGR domain-containing protein [Spirochaetota bacterium]
TYLEFKDEISSKFWEIEVVGNKQIITFGKIGTNGQTQEKEFSNSEEAEKEAKKLIDSKIKKGYSVTSDNNSNEKSEQSQPVLDIRETIFSKYKNLIPDFNKAPSLDLKKGAIKKYDLKRMHFGIIDLLSHIRFGDEYIALEVMQNKQIDEFPVVLYREVNGVLTTISSSIKNWFPCYLIYQINTLLKIVWSPSGYNPQYVKYAKDSLGKIFTEKEAIVTYLKPFGNDKFMEITDTIFKVISDLSVINNPLWDYIGFYRISDGESSYIAEYHEVLKDYFKNKTFDMDRLSKLIINNPQFNEPFSTYCIRDIVTLPMAKDFFHRKVFYSKLEYFYSDVIKKTKKELPNEDFPFKNIVNSLSKQSYLKNSEEISDEFYRIGEYFESKDDYQNAVNCFENSLYFKSISGDRPFYKMAFNKLIELSEKNNDLNYTSYLNYFLKRMNLDILEKVSFDRRFSRYIPDIEAIDGFDLNYNHSLDYCDINIFPNF